MANQDEVQIEGKVAGPLLWNLRWVPLASIKSGAASCRGPGGHGSAAGPRETEGGEKMYLDALSDLVVPYEDEHYAVAPASDADMLRHLMEATVVTQAQLSRTRNRQVNGLRGVGREENLSVGK